MNYELKFKMKNERWKMRIRGLALIFRKGRELG